MVTIFPMHMDYDEVVKLVESKGFELLSRKFDDHLLIFKKK